MKSFLLLLLLVWASLAHAANYTTKSWRTEIKLAKNRSMIITETILVDFSIPQHGLIRRIPFRTASEAGKVRTVDLELDSVLQDGQPAKAKVSEEGGDWQVRVGSASSTLEGRVQYQIKYRVRGGLTRVKEAGQPEHDELFWNVVPTAWATPIDSASIEISSPAPTAGRYFARVLAGRNKSRWGVQVESGKPPIGDSKLITAEIKPGLIKAKINRELPLSYGSTVVVTYPLGTFDEPSAEVLLPENISREPQVVPYTYVPPNPLQFVLPVALLPLLGIAIRATRPKARPLTVRFEPPVGVDPSDAGYLIDGKVDQQDVVAEIIGLAQRGGLKVLSESKKKKGLSLQMNLQPDRKGWTPLDDYVHTALAEFGERVKPGELKGAFSTHYAKICSMIQENATAKGWMETNRLVSLLYVLFPIACIGLAIYTGPQFCCVGPIISFVTLWIGIKWLNGAGKWSTSGEQARYELLGLKEFITRANERELDYFSRVAPDQALFERLLPYALAFGAVDLWSKAFDGIQLSMPDWYQGYRMDNSMLNMAILVDDLQRTTDYYGPAMQYSPPTSSYSSGSGFSSGGSASSGDWGGGGGWDSGGGFSGGGDVGGGGGDSW